MEYNHELHQGTMASWRFWLRQKKKLMRVLKASAQLVWGNEIWAKTWHKEFQVKDVYDKWSRYYSTLNLIRFGSVVFFCFIVLLRLAVNSNMSNATTWSHGSCSLTSTLFTFRILDDCICVWSQAYLCKNSPFPTDGMTWLNLLKLTMILNSVEVSKWVMLYINVSIIHLLSILETLGMRQEYTVIRT